RAGVGICVHGRLPTAASDLAARYGGLFRVYRLWNGSARRAGIAGARKRNRDYCGFGRCVFVWLLQRGRSATAAAVVAMAGALLYPARSEHLLDCRESAVAYRCSALLRTRVAFPIRLRNDLDAVAVRAVSGRTAPAGSN